MANTREFFLSVTQRIFSNWTALKMAVDHGMGPKERAVDFCSYMAEIIYTNEGLDSGEIAGELEDYMDDQFNTELEDNSSVQVAEELLRFYKYCMDANEALVVAELGKLPPLQPWLTAEPVRRAQNPLIVEDNESSSENEEETRDSMVVATDEWTEVRTRRKR